MTSASQPLAVGETNTIPVEYPHTGCVHDLFEAQVQRTPSATAVECEGKSLTYHELNERANQLAHVLLKRGVRKEDLIALYMERSLEMVVALLGILKAGCAYVPIDPAYPADRTSYILEDAGVKVLLTQTPLVKSVSATSAQVLCLDPFWQLLQQEGTQNVRAEIAPQNLAYVIYTSGSTGKPKGVEIEHRSLVNFLLSMRCEPGITPQDGLLAVTTLSFDIAGLEIYLPLVTGARLIVATRNVAQDGRLLMKLLSDSAATLMQATPATWRLLLESGWQGDRRLKILVGGEALSADLARELASRCGSVWNMYGPTETTIWSSIYPVNGHEDRVVSIGRPIPNTTFHILDGDQRPVTQGSEGELYIGGDGLARGYHQRPQLSAEKFVPDPFSSEPGARLYRTGDLARYRADGNVDFLGRTDHQVKVRGFRIELGEIESVLEQHPGVRQAIVMAQNAESGEKTLVAYVVPEATTLVTTGELRRHVQMQLPDYMTPAAYVQLGSLPLTPNGKVDRGALPSPRAFGAAENYVAPRNAVERKLVTLWEQVLDIHPIGVQTSFFDLGGQSLLAARLFMKISRAFGKDLPLAALFAAPTIEQLAKELAGQKSHPYDTLIPIQPAGSEAPFFCVHGGEGGTLFLHRLAGHLGTKQPFYGLQAEGLDGKEISTTTVEQMANHYLSEIRKIQAHGPYRIGGYCFGGLVAFEMAHQLRRDGEQVALLALFSASLRFNRLSPGQSKAPNLKSAQKLQSRLRRILKSPVRSLRWRSVWFVRIVLAMAHTAFCQLCLILGFSIPQALRTMYVVRKIQAAERAYVPKPYPGKLVLFYGQGLLEYDSFMGWHGLAEAFDKHEIGTGSLRGRRDIMNEPLVGIVAGALQELLQTNSSDLENISDEEAHRINNTRLTNSVTNTATKLDISARDE